MLALRCANDGTAIWNAAKVVAMVTGEEKLAPPSVDLATHRPRPPVSGHMANTSPELLVVMAPPTAVPVVSAPLTWTGTDHPVAGFRVLTKAGSSLCQMT